MRKIIGIGKDLIKKGEDFVIAKVVDTSGSTPRKKGAWLLMKEDGTRYGTVGGGLLEAEVEKRALATFSTKESKVHHFGLKPEEQHGLDMRCGGDADVLIEYVDAKKPEAFIEEFDDDTTALIFGAGHVGKALEPVLRYVGFSTIVIDDRAEYANRERFPKAGGIKVIKSFEDAYEDIKTDENTYIVIMTRGHSYDYTVLKQSIRKESAYLGMIGSKYKVADTMKKLDEDGFSKEELDRVYSPIGLSIFAETPEEIAVSIAAELIKVRAGHGER
ncbi:MAG TPA: XdhC/CoxI family protein [Anaerovoracaceae bacterium]|nr:XdhC/CoxI family protein [Anaerovoracaceae bacterium]